MERAFSAIDCGIESPDRSSSAAGRFSDANTLMERFTIFATFQKNSSPNSCYSFKSKELKQREEHKCMRLFYNINVPLVVGGKPLYHIFLLKYQITQSN